MKTETLGVLIPNPIVLSQEGSWRNFCQHLKLDRVSKHHHAGLTRSWANGILLRTDERREWLGDAWENLVGADRPWLEVRV